MGERERSEASARSARTVGRSITPPKFTTTFDRNAEPTAEEEEKWSGAVRCPLLNRRSKGVELVIKANKKKGRR